MLKSLSIENFTVFSRTPKLNFAEKGFNMIIGANGLGKSHLLKLGYTCVSVSHAIGQSKPKTKQETQRLVAEKLTNVFRPEYLGRLTRRKSGRSRSDISVEFHKTQCDLKFSFASNSREEVVFDSHCWNNPRRSGLDFPAIFFPTKEVISMFPGFAAIYRDLHIEIDETYYDLCLALERSLLKGPRAEDIRQFLDPLEEILKGKVRNRNGRFLLEIPGQGNMEIALVAEGHRKLATLAFLLANGSVLKNGIIFWDEPETNLNPQLMRDLVSALILLGEYGIQVFLASHSLFFIKEVDLQLRIKNSKVETRWFSLDRRDSESDVTVSTGKTLEEIEPILSLDMEIEQADRFYEREFQGEG